MFINYRLLNSSKGTANVTYQDLNEFTFEYPCKSNNDCTPYVAEIQAGRYIFEVWGAQGGQNGGLGGYAKGTISLKATTTAYIYIGGQGSSNPGNTNYGGYNGGGNGTGIFRDCTKEYAYLLSSGEGQQTFAFAKIL
ncbi:hypothetical protein TVAG_362490 [Trichomonas vaginalis G3]|uniref:receptor protein-tyrosine kinase n=1 Tax=Trichomonas vaginalis (strain ATCC PRA-98 / G3) TaxID=412133 RepID=A2E627_TRIV3|nr:glycine-rich protein family [Trichomonas vaginalis G3]EAY11869.1 hypothetical protein TVAG_362490 [Trichomonas vaginalis G3]KAI5532279.1 glycine-rich protein family [Trichomonas vaginalis G3]|eukprot:XP_001324092.1 hypothetical protein [Trichomonas vaginalis G3]